MKKQIGIVGAVAILISMFSGWTVNAEGGGVSTLSELKTALASTGTYMLTGDIDVTNSGITAAVTLEGDGHTLNSTETSGNSTIYQNENVNSTLKNLVVNGNNKPEVGIWEGCGTMTMTDCKVQNYNVSTVRKAAIGVGSSGTNKQGTLTLNNVKFLNNSIYDINISDYATVNINAGTELDNLRLQSSTAKLNIGDGWTGNLKSQWTHRATEP